MKPAEEAGLGDTPLAAGSMQPAADVGLESGEHPMSVSAQDRYRAGRELGAGGYGRVRVMYDTRLGRDVADKEIAPHVAGVSEAVWFTRRSA